VWEESTAERYDAWALSPSGLYALERERKLLARMVAPWPRRRQKLVDIGCGTGFFLEMFWDAGFEVTGVDSSPSMLAKARERLGSRADLHLSRAEDLPFEDKEFDYAVLITLLEFADDPLQVVREAARIARTGLLIGFLNRQSLYYLTSGRRRSGSSTLRNANWYSYTRMRRLICAALGPRHTSTKSILPGPPFTWRNNVLFKRLNGLVLPPLLGSFMAMRVDLTGEQAATPLYALKNQYKHVRDGSLQPIARIRH
jgi:ubiquinone/menaquinone biosynthesis C-methylase UbiE